MKITVNSVKAPPHELASVVNLFKEFLGSFSTQYPYEFWLRKCKGLTYGEAIDIIKSLESLPIKYNKAGAIINKIKKWKTK